MEDPLHIRRLGLAVQIEKDNAPPECSTTCIRAIVHAKDIAHAIVATGVEPRTSEEVKAVHEGRGEYYQRCLAECCGSVALDETLATNDLSK